MANAQVNLSFLEMAEGVSIPHMLDTSSLSGQDTINRPTAKYFTQFIFQQLFCCYDIE